jgi:hypothetical protein
MEIVKKKLFLKKLKIILYKIVGTPLVGVQDINTVMTGTRPVTT